MNKGFTEGHFYILLGFILTVPNTGDGFAQLLGIAFLCAGIYNIIKENKK